VKPEAAPQDRAAALIHELGLARHPEGGWYAEVFRSAEPVQPADGRSGRVALTTIDFLLETGQFSAWHRVRSDEVWHLLEGRGLVLWLMPPDLSRLERITLGPVGAGRRPRAVVPAHWWQAAEPEDGLAYVGATVGPGFDFADFSFGRDDTALKAALPRLGPGLARLL
jgi:uncharacterized protein